MSSMHVDADGMARALGGRPSQTVFRASFLKPVAKAEVIAVALFLGEDNGVVANDPDL